MNTSSSKANGSSRQSYDVYVGHVPKTIQQATLFEVFSKHGDVLNVLIRHGTSPFGYAIVKFKHKKDADKVLRDVAKVYVGNHEMEVKNGKRSNQNLENCNAAAGMVKTVTFDESRSNDHQMGNMYFFEPTILPRDCNFVDFAMSKNASSTMTMELMCMNVEDAVTFHGCHTKRFEELHDLSMKLNGICPNLTRLYRKPAKRKVYGALYNADGDWYRCSVIQCGAFANSSMCTVEYIDYGNMAEVSYTDMVELPELLQMIDPFAIKCVISNLKPTLKSMNNISYLHHMVNHRMSVVASHVVGKPEYRILKCCCNGIDVIAELQRNGNAVSQSQISPKASSPNKVDKTSCSKTRENHKSKKVNGTNINKNAVDACNGIDKYSNEFRNGCLQNQVKTSPPMNSHHVQDFIPKKIIKRGSDASVLNDLEDFETVNKSLKVDPVIVQLKLVNRLRGLVPLHTSDLINKAVDLLVNEMSITICNDSKQLVENSYKKYSQALKNIKDSSKEEMLSNLKKKRDEQRIELCEELKRFLDTFDFALLEKRKRIQETITSLASNSSAFLDVYLSRIPDTIEGLVAAFNEEKEKKRSRIEVARKNTNARHNKFMKVFADLQKEFALNTVDGNTDESAEVIMGSWDLKFNEALTELGVALEQERLTSTVIIDGRKSVIQHILEKLDIPKEKIDAECEVYEKYKLLYDDLTYTADMSPVFDELHALCQIIEAFSPGSDNEKLSDKLFELHSALLREDCLLMDIAKAATLHFPEFVKEYPELKLQECQKYSCLLKHSWDIDFFPFLENCNRIEPSYISKLANEPVVIKEFNISSDSENAFMKKALSWEKSRSNSLAKIKGLFKHKAGNIIYAVLPPVWETLYDKPLDVPVDYTLALSLLQQVLVGLCDIHSRGIVHGALHPMSILRKNENVLLDFNYDKEYLQDKLCLKGINFQAAIDGDVFRSADMYNFGCLILWVLFPNLSFHSTDQGIPDINPFHSILQDLLCDKDFSSLSALLNSNSDIRPSSMVLRSNGFLKDFRIISSHE